MYNQWISTVMSKIDCSPSDRAALPAPSSSSHFDDQKRVKDHLFPENHQQEKINSNQSVNKDLLQKGLTIMQLAIIEPQEQASMALYAIALDKFISAEQGADSHKNPSWLSLLNGQTPNRCSMNTKSFNEKTIWSQLLSVLLELFTLMMIIICKTPLPGVISTILLLCYNQLMYLETKYHLVNFALKQIACLLYWMADFCQRYDLPRYVAQVVYIIIMTIVHTSKTCLKEE